MRLSLQFTRWTKLVLVITNVLCLYWTIFTTFICSWSSILKIGDWSTRGCSRNDALSSTSMTVCECNHLTHFAILLSPKPPVNTQPVSITLSLMLIGYIGVTISVISMTVTIIIFIYLNCQWKRRWEENQKKLML